MKQDPLDALSDFYSACHRAIVPKFEAPRRRRSLLVPAAGVTFGFVAALAVALFPATPSPETCRRTVEAIASRQLPPAEPLIKSGLNAPRSRRKAWSA